MGAFTIDNRDGILRLELDLPGEPINKISDSVSEELEGLLDEINADSTVRAVILISGKANSFIAGADIDEFVALKTREDAWQLVRGGQQLVNRLEDLDKPVVAAIHGSCLGAGLEAALACRYRVATDHATTSIGLPEIQLGIIPGSGGCQRLPRLIGLRAALDIILAGKSVSAKRAFSLGIIDELVDPVSLEEVAIKAARRLADGWRPKRSIGGITSVLMDKNPLGRKVVFSRAKKTVFDKTGGNYPAPLAALDAIEHGLRHGIAAGLEREADHFADLAVGNVSRNLVQIFFATTALNKDPGVDAEALAPRPVHNMAVVGAGFMGSAIAGVAAMRAEAEVRLRDTSRDGVAKGLESSRQLLQERLKRKRITEHDYQRLERLLSGGVDWTGFDRADLVIEAVFEDLAVKHEVFRNIEAQVGRECIMASNTSTIPIARIAKAVEHPERVLGMHFFSPVEKMPLLEVIVTDKTAPWVTVTAVAFGRTMGKTVIVVQDRPGFWVNRIIGPYFNEAGRLLEEGVPIEKIDKAMTQFGFPVGPVTLLDEVGLDVALNGSKVLHEAFGERMKPRHGLQRMIDEGRLGRKSGHGFYRYEGGKKHGVDLAAYEIIGAPAGAQVSNEEINKRLVYAMLNEAVAALDEGVVRSARDGDLGAVFGIGFPPFRGGPLRYLDEIGAAQALETLEELSRQYGDRFAPAPRLKRMAKRDESFYLRT